MRFPFLSPIRKGVAAALAAAAVIVSLPAQAADYPSAPVRVIVPTPPGGVNDILARLFASRLGQSLGQSFVVENRGGGGGLIGAGAVARSAPDGHTLLLTYSGPLAVNLNQTPDGIVDLKTIVPIAIIANGQFVLVVHPDVPARTLPEYVAHARKEKGNIKLAAAANGSFPHFLTALLRREAGLKEAVLVPYAGTGPALVDLAGGHTTGHVDGLGAAFKYIESGKLRPLAVFSTQRSSLLPNVPTTAEQGYPQLAATSWFTLAAPAGTPPAVVAKLSDATRRLAQDPAFGAELAKLGTTPAWSSPEDTLAFIVAERRRWAEVLRTTELK